MASSTLTFKDQNGNPVWGLATRIARNNGDTNAAEDERYPDKSGKTTFLEVKKVLLADNGHTVHVNYNEGLNPDWNKYEKLSKHFSDIEDPAQLNEVIVVRKLGDIPVPGPITGYGTCGEWQTEVKRIFDRHGFIGAGPDNEGQGQNQAPNLRATIQEIRNLYSGNHKEYIQWQFETVGNPPELRPRLFIPHPGNDPFERYADIGDWMTTFKWEHCK